MIVQMHLSEWEELKIRHTDEVETLHRKLCKAEEAVKELTIKIEGNKKKNQWLPYGRRPRRTVSPTRA